MANVTALTEIDALADNEVMYVRDASDPADPNKKINGGEASSRWCQDHGPSSIRGNVAVPALAAGAEVDAAIAVIGAAAGDHVPFNLFASPPANIAIIAAWAGVDMATIGFRSTHASVAYAGGSLACMALVTRSSA